jgi:hypothetical protein
LRYTPRNPPPRFLCLELLRLSSLRLTAPPTPTLFGVFAFHRWLPFITGVHTPSIRCFYNSSLSILECIGKVFACWLHQEHKRLPVVQLLHIVSALSFIWEHFFSLHLLSHYSTRWILWVLLHNLHMPSCNLCSPDSPYSLFMFDSSSSCHNICPSQNRVPIFIPLLYFSSIIRVFIILHSRNHSHRI